MGVILEDCMIVEKPLGQDAGLLYPSPEWVRISAPIWPREKSHKNIARCFATFSMSRASYRKVGFGLEAASCRLV